MAHVFSVLSIDMSSFFFSGFTVNIRNFSLVSHLESDGGFIVKLF